MKDGSKDLKRNVLEVRRLAAYRMARDGVLYLNAFAAQTVTAFQEIQ